MSLQIALATEARVAEGQWLKEQFNTENHVCSEMEH
jgi:hypothetical protein